MLFFNSEGKTDTFMHERITQLILCQFERHFHNESFIKCSYLNKSLIIIIKSLQSIFQVQKHMFSRNGKYVINEFQEDTFNRQLPSISLKIPYKRTRQKILNVNQTKFQLDLIRQKIYQKCKSEELQYLDQLQKEKLRFLELKKQEQKRKQQNLNNIITKKYQIQQQKPSKPSKRNSVSKDSLDQLRQIKSKSFNQPKMKLEFSLQQNEDKKINQIAQNQWVNRVRQARKKMQNKFGKYYQPAQIKDSSEEDNSSVYSSIATSRKVRQ